MSSTYDTKQADFFIGIAEKHADWFYSFVLSATYPDEAKESIEIPDWDSLMAAKDDDDDSAPHQLNQIVARIEVLQISLTKTAEDIRTHYIDRNKRPPADVFRDFLLQYQRFQDSLTRCQRQMTIEGSGVDEQTGLKNMKSFALDIKAEMDRLNRKGEAFCLVLATLDPAYHGRSDAETIAVSALMRCLRALDDAYKYSDNGYLILLKQTDIHGAEVAVARLRHLLKQSDSQPITMSYCLAQPVEEEDVDSLLTRMQADLDSVSGDPDAFIKIRDISDIERFVREMNGT